MKNTIKNELRNYILDCINDGTLTNENKDDWHYHAFNEDYYIIYHSRAIDWLKKHDLDTFDAIDIVKEYEEDNFGEFNTKISPESIVNMLVYIYGEEVLYSYDVETIEELKNEIVEELLNIEIVEKVADERYKTKKDFLFFNVVNQTEVSNFIFTDDYPRYEKKYDKFLSVEDAKNIELIW